MNEYVYKAGGTPADQVAKNFADAYDELNGSKSYVMDALDMKSTNQKRAERKLQMSADELGHAMSIIEETDGMMAEADASTKTLWMAMKDRLLGYGAWIKTLHADYKATKTA